MNNRENKGENLLRDKMLQHEFAMDEAAWEKMDALLSERPTPIPPPITPRNLNGMFSRKWVIVLVWVGLAGWWLAFSDYPARTGLLSLFGREVTSSGEMKGRIASVESSGLAEIPAASIAPVATEQEKVKSVDNQVNRSASLSERKTRKPDNGFTSRSVPPVSQMREKSRPEPGNQTVVDHFQAEEPVSPGEKILPPNLAGLLSAQATEETQPKNPAIDSDPEVPVPLDQNLRAYASIAVLPQRNSALVGSARVSPVTMPWTAPHHRRFLQVGLAGGMQMAWVNHRSFDDHIIAPTFGISAKYPLNAHWSLQADALYRRVNNVFNFKQSLVTNAVGTNADIIYITYSQDLKFFELPVVLKRAFVKGNIQVFAGLRPALVLPTYTYESGNANGNNSYSPFDPTQLNTLPSTQEGVRRMDLALTFGGEVRIWRNIWLDIRANQGLLDLTRNDYFQNTQIDRTTDAQVTLRYYFFHF